MVGIHIFIETCFICFMVPLSIKTVISQIWIIYLGRFSYPFLLLIHFHASYTRKRAMFVRAVANVQLKKIKCTTS